MSKTGDTPERQGSLGFKGVSQRTLHPCSLCKVRQSADADDVGGQLGERDYDVVKNRRTRRECEHGRSRLLEMGFGTGEAVELSKEIGIVEPHPTLLGHPRALWDLTSMHSPMVCVGPELLHLNNLVRVRFRYTTLVGTMFSERRRVGSTHTCTTEPVAESCLLKSRLR